VTKPERFDLQEPEHKGWMEKKGARRTDDFKRRWFALYSADLVRKLSKRFRNVLKVK
jgi:hypothetical protein